MKIVKYWSRLPRKAMGFHNVIPGGFKTKLDKYLNNLISLDLLEQGNVLEDIWMYLMTHIL